MVDEKEVEEIEVSWEPGTEDETSFIDIIDEEGNVNPTKPESELEPEQEQENEQDLDEKESRRDRRINKLTAQRRDEERARLSAEQENKDLKERLNRLENNSDKQRIDNFKSEYESVKARLYDAAEEGNTSLQVELTEKIADMRAAARIADSQRQNAPAEPEPSQYQSEENQPPKEALKWWNSNRWFNSKEHAGESAFARAVDAELEGEGFDKEDPEYYKELDKRLQKTFPELYTNLKKPSTVPSPHKGRSNVRGSSSQKDGRIRLTKVQLDMARSLGINTEAGLREYAKEIDLLGES